MSKTCDYKSVNENGDGLKILLLHEGQAGGNWKNLQKCNVALDIGELLAKMYIHIV